MNISILLKKVAEKPKKIKFLLKILRHFSTPAGTTTPITGKAVFIQKKIISMSSVNHFDGFGKSSPCFYKTIEMVYRRHRNDFFCPGKKHN
jgi:hypothetical protein